MSLYLDFFGLSEPPFSIAPNPRFLFMSDKHLEAMAQLRYGVTQGGCFIVITGEIGTGKTTLCREFLRDLNGRHDEKRYQSALILNPTLNPKQLLRAICDEYGLDVAENSAKHEMRKALYEFLINNFADDTRTVLVIDEAQLLEFDALEELRLLTNLESDEEKMLQIVLFGQQELNETLRRNDLRQLAQRITAHFHLKPLAPKESNAYVRHRLSIAGCRRAVFTGGALAAVARLSEGIPRQVNLICDRALLGSYSKDRQEVTKTDVTSAARDIFSTGSVPPPAKRDQERRSKWRGFWLPTAAATVVLAVSVIASNGLQNPTTERADEVGASGAPNLAEEPPAPIQDTAVIEATADPIAERPPEFDPFGDLLELWGMTRTLGVVSDEEFCIIAATLKLSCKRKQTWGEVEQINRPCLIELGEKADYTYGLLTALDRANLYIQNASGAQTVPRQRLLGAPLNALCLWKPISTTRTTLVRGMRGKDVDQLGFLVESALASLTDNSATPVYRPGLAFNADFESKVRQLQSEMAIEVDGVVGLVTQAYIRELLQPEFVPTLQNRI